MKGTVPRAGGRAPADAPVAPAGGDLGPERVPDARLEVAPAPDLAAQLGHAAVERVDRDPLLGRLLPEGPRLARELPELHPVPEERPERRDQYEHGSERPAGGRP